MCAVLLPPGVNPIAVKLNPGLPWQKLHLTKRRLFLPAN
jgi:hypothetical protein